MRQYPIGGQIRRLPAFHFGTAPRAHGTPKNGVLWAFFIGRFSAGGLMPKQPPPPRTDDAVAACRKLVETIEGAGGTHLVRGGHVVPRKPQNVDMVGIGEAYRMACGALNKPLMLWNQGREG